jgi:hypothetical protein
MNKNFFLSVFIAVCLLAACVDNNNKYRETICVTAAGEMLLAVGDSGYTQKAFRNLIYEETDSGSQRIRLDIRTQAHEGTFIFSIINWQWQNPPERGVLEKSYSTLGSNALDAECDSVSGRYLCDGARVTFIPDSNASYLFETTENFYTGFVEISECDVFNKTISGSFDAKLIRFFGISNDTLTVKGTFTDLCYKVSE